MSHRFVDCQGLGGHWTLGTVQAGFKLVHRTSLAGGFGDQLIDANRHLVGEDWEQDDGGNADDWTPVQDVAYLAGTPPCSGFSLLNNAAAAARKRGQEAPATARGPESSINDCMKELVRYAGRCTGSDGEVGPQVVAFESVQGAYKQGGELMTYLKEQLQRVNSDYRLTHVLMSGSSIGAAQFRHRYFPVFHRIPFGVDAPEPRKITTYQDAIGDLMGLDHETWEEQIVYNTPSDWLIEQNMLEDDSPHGVHVIDSHITAANARMRIYLDDLYPYWRPGEALLLPLARYYKRHGAMPLGAERWWDEDSTTPLPAEVRDLGLTGNRRGFSGPRRILKDRPGYVLTGGGIFDFLHWEEKRFLTVRETARLMGLPDTWHFKDVAKGVNQASMWIGKCCPVGSGRWISTWIKRALDGEPGSFVADHPVHPDEFVFDCTSDYKRWDRAISQYTGK